MKIHALAYLNSEIGGKNMACIFANFDKGFQCSSEFLDCQN